MYTKISPGVGGGRTPSLSEGHSIPHTPLDYDRPPNLMLNLPLTVWIVLCPGWLELRAYYKAVPASVCNVNTIIVCFVFRMHSSRSVVSKSMCCCSVLVVSCLFHFTHHSPTLHHFFTQHFYFQSYESSWSIDSRNFVVRYDVTVLYIYYGQFSFSISDINRCLWSFSCMWLDYYLLCICWCI